MNMRTLPATLALAIASSGCARQPVASPPPESVAVIQIGSPPPDGAPPLLVAAPESPEEADEPGMVLIPAGIFPRGCSPHDPHCYDNERPAREIYLDGFHIDRTEVTVAEYLLCVDSGRCSEEALRFHTPHQSTRVTPGTGHNKSTTEEPAPSRECNWAMPGRGDHPINCVSWDQAVAYCAWAGKRLPTEAEWEKAARGTKPRVYPWGNDPPSCGRAVIRSASGVRCGNQTTAPVGSKQAGQSPYRLFDMSGNVWEWVSDWYAEDYYVRAPDRNPPGPPSGDWRVMRGGDYGSEIQGHIDALRVSNRYSFRGHMRFSFAGFRCARSLRASVAQ
jgi:formylglycine-generating enzyme required for sulfatase activity